MQAHRAFRSAGEYLRFRYRAHRSERFAAETKREYLFEVGLRGHLARCVPQERLRHVLAVYAAAVVGDADKSPSAVFYLDGYLRGTRVH